MKNSIIIIIITLLFCSCEEDKTPKKKIKKDVKKEYYFDFDELVHYKANFNAHDYVFLEKEDTTKENLFISEVITEYSPKTIEDTLFIQGLDTLNFIKTAVSHHKFDAINEIFSAKYHQNVYATMCMAKYRDILIFKKNSQIIGIAKICFECEMNFIIGTEVNTSKFGMSGDFKKLEELLKY